MAEQILTAEAVKNALKLYRVLPAAVFFRGLTGFGFIVDSVGQEVIGPVVGSKGVWKPAYFLITGGEKHGRQTLTATDIKVAVDEFLANPLWALLRVTTGRGLTLDQGMSKLVDIAQAQSQITFEVTHFGGRSIVPALETKLGKLTVGQIDWQGGFLYASEGNRQPALKQELCLSRVLTMAEWEDNEALNRAWTDLEKEASRLTLLNTDGSLPSGKQGSQGGEIRAFLTQELTGLLPNTRISEQSGFGYSVRGGAVVVQKTIRTSDLADEVAFGQMLTAFQKEAMRVYSLYCQSLTEAQRKILGQPSDQTFGLVETAEVSFSRDERRSTPQSEALIAWCERRGTPHFPYEGWMPERGKTFRVFCHKWGKGVRCSPAGPLYVEQFTSKDDHTASRQLVRIEFDASEKVVSESKVLLEEKRELRTGTYWSPRAELVNGAWVIIETLTDHDCLLRQQVTSDGAGIDWRCVEDLSVLHERPFPASRVWLDRYGNNWGRQDDLDKLNPAEVLQGWEIKASGQNPDGQTVEVSKRNQNGYGFKWEELPEDLREQHTSVDWPVCACGRARYEAAKQQKCGFCRAYVNCTRCGKNEWAGEDRVSQGATTCNSCAQDYERREEWVAKYLIPRHLAVIRGQARKMARGLLFTDDNGRELIETPDGCFDAVLKLEVCAKVVEKMRKTKGNDLVEALDWVIAGTCRENYSPGFDERAVDYLCRRLDDSQNVIGSFVGMRRAQSAEVIAAAAMLDNRLSPIKEKGYGTQSRWWSRANDLLYRAKEPANTYADALAKLTEVEAMLETAEWYWSHQDLGQDCLQLKAVREFLDKEGQDFSAARAFLVEIENQLNERQQKIGTGEVWPQVEIAISAESRISTRVWAISLDGNILEPVAESRGYKNRIEAIRYGDLPANVLVISHEDDNYGYRKSERWQVHYLPKALSAAQTGAVCRLCEESRVYFAGPTTGWDLVKIGIIAFSTEYSRDLVGEGHQAYEEMVGNLPIDVCAWRVLPAQGEDGEIPNSFVVWAKKATPSVFNQNGEPQTAMAAALRKVGLA